MYNSFKQFLVEEEKTVYFTFGRMNPPTIGHGKVMDTLAKKSGKMPYRIFVSQSQDAKKNPLTYTEKIKYARKMFPRHARSIILNKKIRNALEAASVLHNEGYINIVMVVGSDRLNEFSALLKRYNGQDGRHGFYNFKSIKVISAGDRDPDAEGTEGMSASKMRNAASENDFTTFAQGLPKNTANNEAKKMFNAVRKGMGLKEQKEFKNHIQLEPVSDLRESYVQDKNIFTVGESVVMMKNSMVGKIKHLGTNYLIVESNGETWRCWLSDVDKVDPRESLHEAVAPRWKRSGPDGEIEIKFPTGRRFKIEKQYDENIRHKGEWKVMEWDTRSKDWEWADTYSPKAYAKEMAMKLGQYKNGKKVADYSSTFKFESANEENQPEWGTPESTKKAKKITPGEPKEATSSPQDPDIKDRKGTQPKAYHSGLSKKTKVSRDKHFKKHAKMDDDNPKAYKKAPGDATAKTKPSKHTLRFKQMYGEDK